MFVGLLFLLWEPETSIETEDRWIDALRFIPIYLSAVSETDLVVRALMNWIKKEVERVHSLVWRGKTFSYTFRLLTGDHSFLHKVCL
jgi:hypothetical protein